MNRSAGGKLNRSCTVTIRLDPELNARVDAAAKAVRRTKSSFIEAVLDSALTPKEDNHA